MKEPVVFFPISMAQKCKAEKQLMKELWCFFQFQWPRSVKLSSRGFVEAYKWAVDLAEQHPYENAFLHQRLILNVSTSLTITTNQDEKDPNFDFHTFIERKQFKLSVG
jgi:hypothetical protein